MGITVWAVMNAIIPLRKNFAATVGSVRTVWAVFVTGAVSVRVAGKWKICTVLSAATATRPIQSATPDMITVRNAVSFVSNVRNVCMKTE